MSDVVWVTGATGFTGRHQVAFLRDVRPSLRIVGIDVRDAALSPVDAHLRLDLADSGAVKALAIAEPPRWVIHLAGLMPPAPESDMWRVNVGATIGLLVGLRAADCWQTRVLCVGSAAEYARDAENPISEKAPCGGGSTYGNTKLAQSLTCLRLAAESYLQALVARPFNLIGPGLPTRLVIGWLAHQYATRTDPIQIGNTNTARDFVDVRDAVRAYWLLARDGQIGDIYNVSSEASFPIVDLLAMFSRITGHTPRIERDPARIRTDDREVIVGNSAKLRSATGWLPSISVEQSVRDMVAKA
jgi:GDP-4-dehydro-6-deoxy-D-mannose reductase